MIPTKGQEYYFCQVRERWEITKTRPEKGLNHYVVKQIAEKTKSFMAIERYIVLVFDDMKVQKTWCGIKPQES